jgi:hypothetical protein
VSGAELLCSAGWCDGRGGKFGPACKLGSSTDIVAVLGCWAVSPVQRTVAGVFCDTRGVGDDELRRSQFTTPPTTDAVQFRKVSNRIRLEPRWTPLLVCTCKRTGAVIGDVGEGKPTIGGGSGGIGGGYVNAEDGCELMYMSGLEVVTSPSRWYSKNNRV